MEVESISNSVPAEFFNVFFIRGYLVRRVCIK